MIASTVLKAMSEATPLRGKKLSSESFKSERYADFDETRTPPDTSGVLHR